jgi:hypothetical protein
VGPSKWLLYQQQEETMEHILNQFSQSGLTWDMETQIMHHSKKNRPSIVSTIENWDSITYQNLILDHIWKLLPGFIVLQIWKERNKIIFHSTSSPPHYLGKYPHPHSGNNQS